ncbi:hypothetical protein Thiowin_04249 [Thiorhodovibrio winogradskyi]|uniref:Lipoprotein n=2 Tax=Thiorhodovibrio winogradskyi TaxID=77007 RepID=A0ABZ0SES1_9GAMM
MFTFSRRLLSCSLVPRRMISAAAVFLSLMLIGCASGDGPYLFDAGPGARFSGVSEQKALARIQHFCGNDSVGDQRLGTLLESNQAFRALTREFYRGEISNDEYIDRVFRLHPAADGNVPAIGCVIAEFNNCLAGDCGLKKATSGPASAPAAERNLAMPVTAETEMSVVPELEAEL